MVELVAGELVPIALFLTIGAIFVAYFYFKNEQTKASGNGDYRELAEEAVRGQRVLLEEIEQMNETLGEIERLLKEV